MTEKKTNEKSAKNEKPAKEKKEKKEKAPLVAFRTVADPALLNAEGLLVTHDLPDFDPKQHERLKSSDFAADSSWMRYRATHLRETAEEMIKRADKLETDATSIEAFGGDWLNVERWENARAAQDDGLELIGPGAWSSDVSEAEPIVRVNGASLEATVTPRQTDGHGVVGF